MKVLVIEDNTYNVELLTLRLESLGCQVMVAETAEAGFEMAAERKPDVILLDLKLETSLPGEELAGFGLLARLRAAPETADIPVVIHSIFVRYPGDLPVAMPRVEGYLMKPFKFQELQDVLGEVAGKGKDAP